MDRYAKFDQLIQDYLPDLEMAKEEPMSRHCSFRVGGPVRRMAFPKSGEQIVLLSQFAEDCQLRLLMLGRGSNLLPPDEELDAVVIETSAAFQKIEAGANGVLTVESGAALSRIAETACQLGLMGLEFAHGIPGTLGGAVCMNAGAYGGEMCQVLKTVTALFPEEGIKTLNTEELKLGYRHSVFSEIPEAIILRAVLQLTPGDPVEIRERMRTLMGKRKASQPLEYPSAGSTFKRPEGNFAGTLIDQCGLKGLTVGGAQVSEKHAGFIINRGGATSADIRTLIAQVQERVLTQTGIQLEPEVKIIQ